nr:glycerophosphodiester phosphodiesterase domain-containing protein 4 [Loxodonta africana]
MPHSVLCCPILGRNSTAFSCVLRIETHFCRATYLTTGIWFYWSIVLLSLFGILTAYTSLLLVLGFLLVWEGNKLYLHWCHKILILLVTALAITLLWVLCKLWRDKWLILGLSLKIFAPYWHLACITLMIILSWPVSYYLVQLEGEARYRRCMMPYYEREKTKRCHILTRLKALQIVVGLPFVIVLLFLYMMPLGIHSPCIQDKENLGPKPTFFGHRGAPMFGPENTMMSFEKAVEHGAHGLESDDKPFYRMEPLSEADNEKARNQKIPKLRDLLDLAQKEKKYVIFDLTTPPPKHPHRNTFVRLVVSVILDSKIEPHLIFWLPNFDRDYVRYMAPGFQQVGRLYPLDQLSKENIRIINVDYKELFYNGLRDYKAANITINLYVVNKPWLFSLAWCSRIHSVTTDNIKLLSEIDHPHFFMVSWLPILFFQAWYHRDLCPPTSPYISHCAVERMSMYRCTCCRHFCRQKAFIAPHLNLFFFFYPTGTQAMALRERKIREALSIQPLNQVSESPWTVKAPYPNIDSRKSNHSSVFLLTVPPKKKAKTPPTKKNIKPLMPAKDDVKPPEPKKKPSELTKKPTQWATRRSALRTALPVIKVDEWKMPSKVALLPKTHPREAPMVEPPSQESFLTADSSFRMF